MGFLHPSLLWFAGLAVPLVVLYILKTKRVDERVPAAWLWEKAMREVEARVPFRRLRRDWLLLLQLLILALLVLAAAAPYRRTLQAGGDRVAILLDASASMLADGRFEAAREAARTAVSGLGGGDEAMLVLAGPKPRVLAPLGEDRRYLLEEVSNAAALPSPADLEGAVRLARRVLGESGTILLITDPSSEPPDLAGLKVHRVGTPTANAGITSFAVRPADATGQNHEVFLRVSNYGPDAVEGRVQILVDGKLRDATGIRVPASSDATRTLRLTGLETGLIQANWASEIPDLHVSDDTVSWVLRPRERRRYRIQGRADGYLRRALSSDPDWSEAGAGEAADLEVVMRGTPAETGPPFLWIDPVALRKQVEPGGVILHWNRVHPSLRFLDLHPVKLGKLPQIERPAGARVLAESSVGPFLLEGSRGDRPYLLWAFDPLETDLPLRAAFPLLVRNSLEHLSPKEGGLPGGIPAGLPPEIRWSRDGETRLTTPSGSSVVVPTASGILRLPPLTELGVHRLTTQGEESLFAVSLLSAEETNLYGRSESGSSADSTRRRPSSQQARLSLREIWKPLAVLIVLLLVLESGAFFRRWIP